MAGEKKGDGLPIWLGARLLEFDLALWLGLLLAHEQFHHLDGRVRHGSAGAEDGCYALLIQVVVVLSGNHTAGDDHDILAAKLLQLLDELRNQSLVTGCQ